MAQLPRPPLGGDPGAARRPARATAGARRRAIEQVGVRDAPDAGLPRRRWRPSTTCSTRSPSAATTSTCARTSRARCAAPTSCSPRFARARRRRPRASTCAPSSASARATSRRWPRSTASTSGRSTLDEVPARRRRRCARGEEPLPEQPARRAASRVDPGAAASMQPTHLLFKDIDEPGLHTLDVYERRGGYEALRKALAMTPRRGPRTSSRPRASAAAAAPASRWARRSRSCPRARWTSTSSATPTSPSPAPSRTAS